jgi:hypothetical protein
MDWNEVPSELPRFVLENSSVALVSEETFLGLIADHPKRSWF